VFPGGGVVAVLGDLVGIMEESKDLITFLNLI
jgi:hypothetical protein